jgi:hypothetical protein
VELLDPLVLSQTAKQATGEKYLVVPNEVARPHQNPMVR